MIIKSLVLHNFQVVKDFSADFDGNVYFVTGENERGKSTILKSIGIMLTGNRDDVLKIGEEKGFGKMVVGNDGENYDVDLKFTKANPRGTLTIKHQTTGMKSDNISMLQKIFGYTDFDAVEFSRWSDTAEGRRKQIEAVKALLPKKVQDRIQEIDKSVKEKRDLRKDVNSELKTYTTIVENAEKALSPGDVKTYANPIEISELMQKQTENAQLIEKAKTVRQSLEQRKQQLDEIPNRIKKADEILSNTIVAVNTENSEAQKEYERAIKQAKDRLDNIRSKNDKLIKQATDISVETKNSIDIEKQDFEKRKQNAEIWLKEYEANNPEESNIADELRVAQDHNKKNASVVDYLAKKEQKDLAQTKSDNFDIEISKLLKERETLIAKSKLPIKGLTFTDDGLELNGVPFVEGKVSDSQIMEVAVNLVIATNPTVKVFRIARGESLGEDRLQAIIDIAKKNGFQGFIEEVKRGQSDLVIEEYNEN